MLLRTVTLGCKVNQYETEFVREGLVGIGWQDAAEDQAADLCVVNTCTVTSEGDSKSRQVIRRLARDNPAARIVVMGCYATRAPEEIAALPNVTEIVTDKRELPDLLGRFGVTDVPTGISYFGRRHRAYLKVQDGCLLRCSFCIIPHVRPALTSRPLAHILDEARRLIDNGYRELVLTGIHLGHYGVDFSRDRPRSEWTRLAHLVEAIAGLEGTFRIRLSSIEATEVTRHLIDVMAAHGDKICPHLHISMQSGSDAVLRRMRRRWGAQRLLDRCRMVLESLDQPALTTDVIVGFPGETEAEFSETCAAVRETGFSKIHVFPFSPRRGTPAAKMPDQVEPQLKKDRVRRLTQVERELQQAYFTSLVGRQLQVLLESPAGRTATTGPGETAAETAAAETIVGTSCRYAPVEVNASPEAIGQLVSVTPKELQDGRLVGVQSIRMSSS